MVGGADQVEAERHHHLDSGALVSLPPLIEPRPAWKAWLYRLASRSDGRALLHLSARLLLWTLAVACVARWALVEGWDTGWVLMGVGAYVAWDAMNRRGG